MLIQSIIIAAIFPLQVISFIVQSIQSTIIGKSEVSAFFLFRLNTI